MSDQAQREQTIDALTRAMSGAPYRRVGFSYTAADGKVTARRVEPIEVKKAVLYAFDTEKQALRQFKIVKIEHAEVLEQYAAPADRNVVAILPETAMEMRVARI